MGTPQLNEREKRMVHPALLRLRPQPGGLFLRVGGLAASGGAPHPLSICGACRKERGGADRDHDRSVSL
jgi:hypothetical protein